MALRWIKRFLSAVAVALFLVVISAVIVSGSSAGGTLRSGRSVVAKSDSIYCSCTFGDDTATIKTGRKEIVVNPTSLVVDGVVMAEIDKNVTRVQISLKRGVVTFVADGLPVDTALR